MKTLLTIFALSLVHYASGADLECVDVASTHKALLSFSEDSRYKSFNVHRGNGGLEYESTQTWVETYYYEEKVLTLELQTSEETLVLKFPVKRYDDETFEDVRNYFVGDTRRTINGRGYDISLLGPRRDYDGWPGYLVFVRIFDGAPFVGTELGRYRLICRSL